MDWVNLLGYVAAASVLAMFCVRTMIPLHILDSSAHPRSRQQRAVLHPRVISTISIP